MATPHVAWGSALILNVAPNLSPQDVIDILKKSVDPIRTDQPSGTGVINALKAVTSASGLGAGPGPGPRPQPGPDPSRSPRYAPEPSPTGSAGRFTVYVGLTTVNNRSVIYCTVVDSSNKSRVTSQAVSVEKSRDSAGPYAQWASKTTNVNGQAVFPYSPPKNTWYVRCAVDGDVSTSKVKQGSSPTPPPDSPTPNPTATAKPTVTPKPTASPGNLFFDDFIYTSSSDPNLTSFGWSPRSGGGGPGNGSWSTNYVTFATGPVNTVLRLKASISGNSSTQSELDYATINMFEGHTPRGSTTPIPQTPEAMVLL